MTPTTRDDMGHGMGHNMGHDMGHDDMTTIQDEPHATGGSCR